MTFAKFFYTLENAIINMAYYTLQNICYTRKYNWSNTITCTEESKDFFLIKIIFVSHYGND